MRKWAAGLAAVAWLMLSPLPAEAWLASDAFSIHARSTTSRIPSSTVVTLDGVTLEITTSFLSNLQFATPDPGSAIQVATAVEREPLFRELSITAVPFGVSPPTESVPVARAGGEEAYRAALRAYRREQGGHPQAGAILHLFGEPVAGSTSVVDLRVSGEARVPVSITEWVVEAGPRLWIVRASRQLEGELDSARSASPSSLAFPDSPIGSADLSQPSTSLASAQRQKPPVTGASAMTASAPDLPSPPWWGGECDATHFYSATQVFPYPLGAEYRGLKACGPRPWFDQDVWALVDFGAGSLQIEWQCPELSMRFLYLAYGILPYPANGNQVVDNYGGELLEKEWNCTEGRAPQPDDVLSYGATTTYGHTSVVVASDVDSTGDGTIQVIEQNGSETGHNTLAVNDWCVTGYTDIVGWLHEPGWSVEIYGDDSLIDPCATGDRAGTYVFETWGEGAPAEGCPDDDFSVRFSRTITFPGGDYTFGLGYDEGARLKIDGETVVDGWGSSSQHYVTRHLDPGEHHVTVEAYDGFGTAALSAFWWGPGFELARETRDGSQWYAEYWGNPALWWEPAVMVREGSGSLSHAWSSGGPADSLPGDHFSARFRRQVSF
ncbi:MAG: PA14 domain-containing protein, partial [Anaerolineae bacterium]